MEGNLFPFLSCSHVLRDLRPNKKQHKLGLRNLLTYKIFKGNKKKKVALSDNNDNSFTSRILTIKIGE